MAIAKENVNFEPASDLDAFDSFTAANELPAVAAVPSAPTVVADPPAGVPAFCMNTQQFAEEGFEGIEYDWTSFPRIALKPEGIFEDDAGANYGKIIDGYMMTSKSQFLYKAKGERLNNRTHLYYSFTKPEHMDKDETIQSKIAEWAAEGRGYEIKKYTLVNIVVSSDDPKFNHAPRVISIAPLSQGRFATLYTMARAIGGGQPDSARNVKVRFSVGPKVTKADNPYYPWDFSIAP